MQEEFCAITSLRRLPNPDCETWESPHLFNDIVLRLC